MTTLHSSPHGHQFIYKVKVLRCSWGQQWRNIGHFFVNVLVTDGMGRVGKWHLPLFIPPLDHPAPLHNHCIREMNSQ